MRLLKSTLVSCLLAHALFGTGCSKTGDHRPEDSKDAGPVVKVVQSTTRKVVDYAYFTGRIEAPESVKVQSRVTGYLDTVDFVPGAEVKAGQRLFLIDPRPYKAALDRELGRVDLAKASLKLAKADYARALEIAKTPGAISQQDVDRYAAAQDEAEANVAAAKANSEEARLNVEFTNITAPVDGVVGRNLLTVGNLVKQDTSLLTTVVSQDPMYVLLRRRRARPCFAIQRMIQKGGVDRGESTPERAAISEVR